MDKLDCQAIYNAVPCLKTITYGEVFIGIFLGTCLISMVIAIFIGVKRVLDYK